MRSLCYWPTAIWSKPKVMRSCVVRTGRTSLYSSLGIHSGVSYAT